MDNTADNAIAQAVKAMAESKRITLLAAAELLKFQIRERAARLRKERQFGTMPEQYDPTKDESHPDRGWNPTSA